MGAQVDSLEMAQSCEVVGAAEERCRAQSWEQC